MLEDAIPFIKFGFLGAILFYVGLVLIDGRAAVSFWMGIGSILAGMGILSYTGIKAFLFYWG